MKKTILFLSFIAAVSFILIMSCKNTNISNVAEIQKTRLESPIIKSVSKYIITPEDSVGTIFSMGINNQKGLKVRFYYYDGDGNVTDSILYEYDENGNNNKMVTYRQEDVTTELYTYNNDGHIKTSSWSRLPVDEPSSKEFFYDEKGNEIEIKYLEDGKYEYSTIFEIEYDKNGNVISEKKYDKFQGGRDIETDHFIKAKYDKKGNMVERRYCGEGNTVYSIEEFEYDSNGNVLKKIENSGIGKKIEIYEYNEYGELIKSLIYRGNDVLKSTITCKYEKYGNQIYKMEKEEDGYVRGERSIIVYF